MGALRPKSAETKAKCWSQGNGALRSCIVGRRWLLNYVWHTLLMEAGEAWVLSGRSRPRRKPSVGPWLEESHVRAEGRTGIGTWAPSNRSRRAPP
jgi:hypothetical protein